MTSLLKKFLSEEDGISSVEYALLLAFIGAGVAAAALGLGDAVQTRIGEAETDVETDPVLP